MDNRIEFQIDSDFSGMRYWDGSFDENPSCSATKPTDDFAQSDETDSQDTHLQNVASQPTVLRQSPFPMVSPSQIQQSFPQAMLPPISSYPSLSLQSLQQRGVYFTGAQYVPNVSVQRNVYVQGQTLPSPHFFVPPQPVALHQLPFPMQVNTAQIPQPSLHTMLPPVGMPTLIANTFQSAPGIPARSSSDVQWVGISSSLSSTQSQTLYSPASFSPHNSSSISAETKTGIDQARWSAAENLNGQNSSEVGALEQWWVMDDKNIGTQVELLTHGIHYELNITETPERLLFSMTQIDSKQPVCPYTVFNSIEGNCEYLLEELDSTDDRILYDLVIKIQSQFIVCGNKDGIGGNSSLVLNKYDNFNKDDQSFATELLKHLLKCFSYIGSETIFMSPVLLETNERLTTAIARQLKSTWQRIYLPPVPITPVPIPQSRLNMTSPAFFAPHRAEIKKDSAGAPTKKCPETTDVAAPHKTCCEEDLSSSSGASVTSGFFILEKTDNDSAAISCRYPQLVYKDDYDLKVTKRWGSRRCMTEFCFQVIELDNNKVPKSAVSVATLFRDFKKNCKRLLKKIDDEENDEELYSLIEGLMNGITKGSRGEKAENRSVFFGYTSEKEITRPDLVGDFAQELLKQVLRFYGRVKNSKKNVENPKKNAEGCFLRTLNLNDEQVSQVVDDLKKKWQELLARPIPATPAPASQRTGSVSQSSLFSPGMKDASKQGNKKNTNRARKRQKVR